MLEQTPEVGRSMAMSELVDPFVTHRDRTDRQLAQHLSYLGRSHPGDQALGALVTAQPIHKSGHRTGIRRIDDQQFCEVVPKSAASADAPAVVLGLDTTSGAGEVVGDAGTWSADRAVVGIEAAG